MQLSKRNLPVICQVFPVHPLAWRQLRYEATRVLVGIKNVKQVRPLPQSIFIQLPLPIQIALEACVECRCI
jgi:hypothetical protein